jgi:hypothetical protein
MNEPAEQSDEQEPQIDGGAPETAPETPEAPTEETGEEEEGEAPEAPSGEPVPETEAVSEKEIERAMKALGKEADRHTKRVAEIAPDLAPALLPCVLCEPEIPGFVMPAALDHERVSRVLTVLGYTPPRDLEDDPHSELCKVCKGWGEVQTGSHVQGYEAVPCMDCGGKGLTGERFTSQTAVTTTPYPVTPSNGPSGSQFSPEDLAEAERLKGLGMVVIAPTPPA